MRGYHASLSSFSKLLEAYPAAFSGNPLNLLLIDDAEPIPDGRGYLRQLDAPSLTDERREYLFDANCPWPFPRVILETRPDPWLISEALFARFGEARQVLATQGDVAERISRRVRESAPLAVGLIIVDGLSYYDLPPDIEAEPLLVHGITSTEFGYREVVGKPSISRRLFALGYASQRGYTYFDSQVNDLARDVYATFAPAQVTRIKAFDHVVQAVEQMPVAPSFFQITMAGLDQLSHSHWDRPPREEYLKRILDYYEAFGEALRMRFGQALTVLTADHGILWRDHVEDRLEIAFDLLPEDAPSPRYIKGGLLRGYGRVCRCDGRNYTLFRVPYMTRPFRINEWGVHGGISAWESVVPLIMRES